MKWSIGVKIGMGFALGLAMLILLGALSYRNSRELIRSVERRVHSYDLISALDLILQELLDAESGQRGFIITGDDGYLKPYDAAITASQATLKDLRQLTASDPAQQKGSPLSSRSSGRGSRGSRPRLKLAGPEDSRPRRIESCPVKGIRRWTLSGRRGRNAHGRNLFMEQK